MRLIDADAMCVDLATVNPKYKTMIDWANRVIKAQPTVEAELVRHGQWIRPYNDHYKQCSVCKRIHYTIPWNAEYCPFCGAKMDGGDL